MASSPKRATRKVLRIVGSIAAISYLVLIVSELQSTFKYGIPKEESVFSVITTLALLVLFFIGFLLHVEERSPCGISLDILVCTAPGDGPVGLAHGRGNRYYGCTHLHPGVLLVIYGWRKQVSNNYE
ncbi:MAG: hypothetical protein GY751_14525 [Bacteroidetes bacterium]|nr:hypothetical protein [Bacteroidota bacterium]